MVRINCHHKTVFIMCKIALLHTRTQHCVAAKMFHVSFDHENKTHGRISHWKNVFIIKQ